MSKATSGGHIEALEAEPRRRQPTGKEVGRGQFPYRDPAAEREALNALRAKARQALAKLRTALECRTPERETALREGLTIAIAVAFMCFTEATEALPEAEREAPLREALTITMAIAHSKARADALHILASYLPETLHPDARAAARAIPDEIARDLIFAALATRGKPTEYKSTVENSEITADNKPQPRISGAARITGEKDVGPMNGPLLKAERHLGDVLREALRVARVECPAAVPAIEQALRIAERKVTFTADHKTLPLPVLTEEQITAMMQRGREHPWKNRDSSLRRVSPVRYFEDNYNDIVGDDTLIPLSILRKADRDLYDRINNWKSDASNRDAVKRFVTRDEIHLAEVEILATRPDLLPPEQQAQAQLTAGRRVLRQLGYKR